MLPRGGNNKKTSITDRDTLNPSLGPCYLLSLLFPGAEASSPVSSSALAEGVGDEEARGLLLRL